MCKSTGTNSGLNGRQKPILDKKRHRAWDNDGISVYEELPFPGVSTGVLCTVAVRWKGSEMSLQVKYAN